MTPGGWDPEEGLDEAKEGAHQVWGVGKAWVEVPFQWDRAGTKTPGPELPSVFQKQNKTKNWNPHLCW